MDICLRPSSAKPRIGISCADYSTPAQDAICRAVTESGGVPVLLKKHNTRCVEQDFLGFQGIIVMGNDEDINPADYGHECHPETQVDSNTCRARYEEKLMAFALTANVPLLAICGGMQRLNVMGGGTLIQHLPDMLGHGNHLRPDAMHCPVETISLVPGTKLYALAEMKPLVFDNSLHHQAIGVVRPDFRVSARASDGVIEAIEPDPLKIFGDHPFALGVQWHPEFGVSALSQGITAGLTEAAASLVPARAYA
jgi:putative glutamine amidotransferase